MYYELTKTDKDNNNVRKFKAKLPEDMTITRDSGVTNIPITESNSSESILVKLFGTSESVKFGFRITAESGEDLSLGTQLDYPANNPTINTWNYSGGFTNIDPDTGVTRTSIKTIDQIKYIKTNFITYTSDDKFSLTIKDANASSGTIAYLQGVFSDLSIIYKVGADLAEVSITFNEGVIQ